jgi:hypothetical protein
MISLFSVYSQIKVTELKEDDSYPTRKFIVYTVDGEVQHAECRGSDGTCLDEVETSN